MSVNTNNNGMIFNPQRVVSWWSTLEDLLSPEKYILDKVKRKAELMAKAKVDAAVQFGFHLRFDFAPYFGALHGYLANVAEELHIYNIKFIEHYSCNVIARPCSLEEKDRYHKFQRHHIGLYPDAIAAKDMGYAGYKFDNLRGIDVRTGDATYSWTYQAQMFCHNNPDFRDMHRQYLKRLILEVPLDGIMSDDMCEYASLAACGCKHCRERFKREYGYDLPDFSDTSFWGNTQESPLFWGNYENPIFRSWIDMRFNAVAEDLEMIRETIGPDIALMTCCSNTGPNYISSLGMQYDRIVKSLNLVMLENCGFDVKCAGWTRNEPEAMLQKSYARRQNIPAIALGYALYDGSAYLGWAAARFWGVANWCSTLNQGMIEDPKDLKDTTELIGAFNCWELENSNLDLATVNEITEVRLGYDRYCKENGWKDENSVEQWVRVCRWSKAFLDCNVGYKFIRAEELSNISELEEERTPIVLDGFACISDEQYQTILTYAKNGGKLWVVLPLGTHDDRGFIRKIALQDEIRPYMKKNVKLFENSIITKQLDAMIKSEEIIPRIIEIEGDGSWATRLYSYNGEIVLHLLNKNIEGVAHPTARDDWFDGAILESVRSLSECKKLVLDIDFASLAMWKNPILKSPELKQEQNLSIKVIANNVLRLNIDVSNIVLYGVISDK